MSFLFSNIFNKFFTFAYFLTVAFSTSELFASNTPQPIQITSSDRILIFAPHPDDEAIGTAGVIQRAIELKVPFKIVYLTNGDNNELAFLVYKKHPILSRKGLLGMGELRRKEAVEAMNFLGVDNSQQVFLGYPDFGTSNIFVQHWGKTRPFKSMLTRVREVPYDDVLSPEAPYTGESILNDFKNLIQEFKPTKIFVTMPADSNGDHRAIFLFLQVALWDLEGNIPPPQVYPFIIHVADWPLPRGAHPELALDPSPRLALLDIDWLSLELTPEEIEKKEKAISFYRSQNAYNPKYLYSFVRKNELFGTLPNIYLTDIDGKGDISWEEPFSKQKISGNLAVKNSPIKSVLNSVAYARKDGMIYILLKTNSWTSELDGINIFLIGYKKNTNFADLPKIRIHINYDRFATAFDLIHHTRIKELQFSHQKNDFMIGIPLNSLGNPDFIFTSSKVYITDYPLETTEWRTLIVNHNEPN